MEGKYSLLNQAIALFPKDEQQGAKMMEEAIIILPEAEIVRLAGYECHINNSKVAEHMARIAAKRYPKNIDLLNVMAISLKQQARCNEAIEIFRKALKLDPANSMLWSNMANVFMVMRNYEEAMHCFQKMPFSKMSARNQLARARLYLEAGIGTEEELNEARKLIDIILAVQQNIIPRLINDDLQAIFIYALEYDKYNSVAPKKDLIDYWISRPYVIPLMYQMDRVETMQDRVDLLESHRLWGRRVSNYNKSGKVPHKVRKRLNGKVRIGLLTGFRDSHGDNFIRPLLEYWNKDRFELYVYALSTGGKGNMCRLAAQQADYFIEQPLHAESDIITQSIAHDNLDVLMEVSAVHLQPKIITSGLAPVQISWLDYPYSSGLPIDYIMVDPYIKPSDNLLLEKPLMLPETWVAMDEKLFKDPLPFESTPEDRNGYLTFGTMNSSFKLNPKTFRVWAELLLAVPNSRFLYVRPEVSMKILRDNFCKYMAMYGIDPSRIIFKSTMTNHMVEYNNIDISLDTFPRTGGTTTCESLWMGVPVVTLVGHAFFERLSYSNLNNIGLGDLCALSIKEYKDIVLRLVADKESRRYLRHNLRQMLLQSPLGQAERFAKNFVTTIVNVLGK